MSNLSSTPERLLDATQVAEQFGLSRSWVLEHASGKRRPVVPSIKLGKSVRFRPSDIAAFVEECVRLSK